MIPYTRPWLPAQVNSPSLGQTFDEMLGVSPAVGDGVRLVVHGTAGFLGFYVGTTAKGFISGLGWFLGIANGIGAALDVVSLIKRATGTHP